MTTSVLAGVAGGLGAYVAGYVLTFLLMSGEVRRAFGDVVPTWKGVGWYLYSAHFVDLTRTRSVGPLGGTETINLIAESTSGTATLLYAVPVLALVAACAVAAFAAGPRDIAGAAAVGGGAVVGYGLLAVLGGLAVAHTVEGSVLGVDLSATVEPNIGAVVVIAAVVYPVVFGTAGALAGWTLRSREDEQAAAA